MNKHNNIELLIDLAFMEAEEALCSNKSVRPIRQELKSVILKDRRELVEKAIEMARENNEGVEITICPEMKYTQQQILEKLEVRDV